jgi:hypothetical protein
MKVSEAIEMLSRYKPDDEIIIEWWDKELFDSWMVGLRLPVLSTDSWADAVYDWENTNEVDSDALRGRAFEMISWTILSKLSKVSG